MGSQRCAARIGGPMLELDVETIRRDARVPALSPFDGEDRAIVEIFTQASVLELRTCETIEVCVNQPQTSGIFLDQREGGTADRCRFGAKPLGYASHQRGFPGSEISEQGQHIPALSCLPERAAKPMGVAERRQPQDPRLRDESRSFCRARLRLGASHVMPLCRRQGHGGFPQ